MDKTIRKKFNFKFRTFNKEKSAIIIGAVIIQTPEQYTNKTQNETLKQVKTTFEKNLNIIQKTSTRLFNYSVHVEDININTTTINGSFSNLIGNFNIGIFFLRNPNCPYLLENKLL